MNRGRHDDDPTMFNGNRAMSNVLRGLAFGLVLSISACWTTQARAQDSRYELGRRVRAFEREWELNPDATARKQASVHLSEAVNNFFRLRFSEAARAISEARFALAPGDKPAPEQRWAESLRILPDSRFLDAATSKLSVLLDAFYPVGTEVPSGSVLQLSLLPDVPPREFPIKTLPMTATLDWNGPPPGDHTLRGRIVVAGKELARSELRLSVAPRLVERLDAVTARIKTWPDADTSSETADRATARTLSELLRNLAQGRIPETDFPAARLLDQLESLSTAASENRPYHGKDRTGEFWLTMVGPQGRAIPTRVRIPDLARSGRPLPVVVALHGAGGSENMFFDSYGAGAIVDLCRRRDWILVAPRAGASVEDVLSSVAKLYPLDWKRVFLTGHSMGAATAVAAAVRSPERFAGVAALGGGGRVRASEGLKAVPFFVAAGTADFAREGARTLVESLRKADVRTVLHREYLDIEHLAIVQVALPDTFAFFDRIAVQGGIAEPDAAIRKTGP